MKRYEKRERGGRIGRLGSRSYVVFFLRFRGKHLFFLFSKCLLIRRRVVRRGFHGVAERHSDLRVGFSLGPFLCVPPFFCRRLLFCPILSAR